MASIISLDGPPPRRGLGATSAAGCRCIYNKRTKRSVQLCPVPKTKKHRSGWKFTGPCR